MIAVRFAMIALAFVLATSRGVAAYESGTCASCEAGTCASCEEGPDSARHPWRAPVDEHRQIWETTVARAGLPPTVSDAAPFTLRLYTADASVAIHGAPQPSIAPVDFNVAVKAIDRPPPNTIGEFTQIPDWSYALWDWAAGNEQCPEQQIPGSFTSDPVSCHNYLFHMGPLNSNHFLPQAQDYWAYYHRLAMDRAAACDAIEQRMGGERSRFHDYLVACEQEALILEAIGHHFLQDSWSMGHMWERWGGSDPSDFSNAVAAAAVGAFTGIIHGARAFLQSHLAPSFVNDPLCWPADGVQYKTAPFSPAERGAGDDYLTLVLNHPEFDAQRAALLGCAVASVREVYGKLSSPELGAAGAPAADVVLPTSLDNCFRARATNQAIAVGAAIDWDSPDDGHHHVPLTPDLATLIKYDSLFGPLSATEAALLASGISGIAAEIDYWSKVAPLGTTLASGGLPPFLGSQPNHVYAGRIASYADPQFPWARRPIAPAAPATVLARAFHRAQFDEWCSVLNKSYLLALRSKVATAVATGDAERIAIKTEICTEFVSRHARPWDDAAPRYEPLCAWTSADPNAVDTIDVFASDSSAAAVAWCACGNGRIDAGEDCDLSAQQGDANCPGRCLPVDYAKPVGSHHVFAGCQCVPCS